MAEFIASEPLRSDARRNRARVLAAAEAVFAAVGVSASMEDIARRAGVGVGTIYRHFSTKEVLLEAVIVARFARLADEAESLSAAEDAGTAFFELFHTMVSEAATKKTLADPLARAGVDIKDATSASAQRLVRAFGRLLDRAQRAGAVRVDTNSTEVMAILGGVCLGAQHAEWDGELQGRVLHLVFDGLRASSA